MAPAAAVARVELAQMALALLAVPAVWVLSFHSSALSRGLRRVGSRAAAVDLSMGERPVGLAG
jgi:hypothetical protein